jgi:hypothetical protein
MEDGMSNDAGSRSTTSGFKQDDTQPLATAPMIPPLPGDGTSISPASEVPTPPSLVPERRADAPSSLSAAHGKLERSVRALWVAMAAVATLALVSLAVNVVLVTRLLAIRTAVAGALDDASRSLDSLAGEGIGFEFPVSQTVPFEGNVPFKQEFAFPFKGNIPIDTTISVPLDMGLLGRQVINVPVKTTVPVDITVPVRVDETFHVKTQVPVRMNVPIRIGANDPPLKDWIAQARQWLERMRHYI